MRRWVKNPKRLLKEPKYSVRRNLGFYFLILRAFPEA